jgi:hypothetical protein|eukprot:COSAG01_NODE_1366_length_10560_cov_6.608642_11_plen_166_part_00
MNIFYLDSDPVKAAQIQYNKHVVKMILESAQMLCTAHHHYDNGHNVPYKKAHYNHPSTIWCRQNVKQYKWLYDHMIALGNEYTKRYNKKHLTITKCADILKTIPPGIPNSTFEEPPQCMPEQYKVVGCSITAYWNYYEQEKYTVAAKDEPLIFRPDEKKIIQTFS